MEIVELIKTRSTCLRRQVGALIVKDKRILSTGYNGAPVGCAHCCDIGCLRDQMGIPSGQRQELCRAIHAEQNAIVQAAYSGTSVKGGTMYVTTQPCSLCAKMIINAGIVKIVFRGEYPDELAMDMLKEAGVRVVKYEKDEFTRPQVSGIQTGAARPAIPQQPPQKSQQPPQKSQQQLQQQLPQQPQQQLPQQPQQSQPPPAPAQASGKIQNGPRPKVKD